jgi:hypothetical protein
MGIMVNHQTKHIPWSGCLLPEATAYGLRRCFCYLHNFILFEIACKILKNCLHKDLHGADVFVIYFFLHFF